MVMITLEGCEHLVCCNNNYNPSNLSLAHDWSKHVTWANITQLKLGNIRGYFPNSKLTVFLELRSRKTVCFSEQIMSKDKYASIFSRQMKAIVYLFEGGGKESKKKVKMRRVEHH